MSFIHCHNCNWEQDDFYEPNGYNPFDWMCENLKPELFNSNFDTLLMRRTYIVEYLRNFANRIEKMKWITYEDYEKNNPERKCPKCGHELCID